MLRIRQLCRSKGLKKQHSVDTIEIKLDEIGRFFVGGGGEMNSRNINKVKERLQWGLSGVLAAVRLL